MDKLSLLAEISRVARKMIEAESVTSKLVEVEEKIEQHILNILPKDKKG